jgi:6,7-dimethyl-8-ribityllumazine synthase
MTRILIIEARFYNHLADGLLTGATQVLDANQCDYQVVTVPGIYELATALSMHVASQAINTLTSNPLGQGFDGYITLGCAIRGESDHYQFISAECMRALSQLAQSHHLALGNGVLTVHNEQQALVRSDPERKNMGGQAARACLRMLQLKQQLGIN